MVVVIQNDSIICTSFNDIINDDDLGYGEGGSGDAYARKRLTGMDWNDWDYSNNSDDWDE